MTSEYQYGEDFQRKILALYVREPKLTYSIIEPQNFTSPIFQDISRLTKGLYDKHQSKLSKETVYAVVRAYLGKKRQDIWPEYRRTIRKIFKDELSDQPVILEQAMQFARDRRFRKALVAAENHVNNQKYDAAIAEIVKLNGFGTLTGSSIFHTWDEIQNAPSISFAIDGFLQNGAATLIGGLSGHGKTFMMLSVVRALLRGPKKQKTLWGQFKILEKARRVIYLIPESSLPPIKTRLIKFGLMRYLKDERLLLHTLSQGPKPKLDDPRLLAEAKGAHVFLDTAIRFGEGKESDASDNQQGLASGIFGLLSAGALSVTGLHHSAKAFSGQNIMTLENVLRGSGDIGAMTATVWGVKQLDEPKNIIHVENVKARDFSACEPFQIIGRPWIDQERDWRLHKKSGVCNSLAHEQQENKPGASQEKRDAKKRNLDLMREWLAEDPELNTGKLVKRFKGKGINVEESTVRGYKYIINGENSGK